MTYSVQFCDLLENFRVPQFCIPLPGQEKKAVRRTASFVYPASPLAASPSAEIRLQPFFFCVCRVRNAPARRRNVRFSGFRWVRARLSGESGTNRRHGRDSVEAAYYPALFSEAESACTAISSSSCAICSSGRRIRLSSGFSFDSRFMLPYQTRQRSRIAKCSRQVWDGKTSMPDWRKKPIFSAA